MSGTLIQYNSVLIRRKQHQGCVYIEKRPREGTPGRQLTTSQRERPQEKPSLPTSWSGTPNLQNYEKIHFCGLILQVYGSLRKLTQASKTMELILKLHVKIILFNYLKSVPLMSFSDTGWFKVRASLLPLSMQWLSTRNPVIR